MTADNAPRGLALLDRPHPPRPYPRDERRELPAPPRPRAQEGSALPTDRPFFVRKLRLPQALHQSLTTTETAPPQVVWFCSALCLSSPPPLTTNKQSANNGTYQGERLRPARNCNDIKIVIVNSGVWRVDHATALLLSMSSMPSLNLTPSIRPSRSRAAPAWPSLGRTSGGSSGRCRVLCIQQRWVRVCG